MRSLFVFPNGGQRLIRLFSPSSKLIYIIWAVGGAAVYSLLALFFTQRELIAQRTLSIVSLQRISASLPHITYDTAPTPPTFPFPLKVWQTGPPVDSTRDNAGSIATWSKMNPDFRYEFLSDAGAEQYVFDHFKANSRIVETYKNMSDVILRADLLRLLLMRESGGVYSDIDTDCLIPILDWIPAEYYNSTRVVIGIEVDRSDDDVPDDKKDFQLCQWTLMAAPGNIHMERVVDLVIDHIEKVAEEKGVSLSELGKHITVPDVIHTTGPVAFTNALLESLSITLGETITTYNISGLKGPRLLDDVLILPINAFGGHQSHSHSGESDRGPKLIQHHFASSWWKAKDEQQV